MTQPNEPKAADVIQSEHEKDEGSHRTPGTLVLALILLLSFAVYYFANWKALADTWPVR
ncbi:MAG: hypothetical protein IPJ65_13835 [Archangiaceae bacterium]|nr:hypothetical protein [Archangiaceae bacterium]